MPDRIKVALMTDAGGAHLGAYYSALAKADEVESVVLSDPSGHSVDAAKKSIGKKFIKAYRNHKEMLAAEKPGMALISIEAAKAPPVIEAALDADVHVFAEKPSCIRAEDFEKLATKADSKHLYLMLALANRLNPEIQQARDLIRQGKIGKIYGIDMHIVADQTRLTRSSYHKGWFAQKARAGGGHLIWLGIHWLDLATYVTGSKVEEVAGFAGNVGGQPIDIEDSAAVAMKFDNGTFGTLTSGYYLDKRYHTQIKIWGSHGWVLLESMADIPLTWYSSKEKSPSIHKYEGPKEPRGYSPFVRAAVRACAGLQDAPITSADSLRVLKTIFAFYEAAETGKTQQVS